MKKFLLFFLFASQAQIVNIPDANFKSTLIANGADTNADGVISYTQAAEKLILNANYSAIYDMTRIDAFINLQELYCNQIFKPTSFFEWVFYYI